MLALWVNLTPGVPAISDFMTTGGQGGCLCVNVATSRAYYLASGDVVTLIAGGGGGSSGFTVVTKTAGYTETITTGDQLTLCNLAAGFTVVLPTAASNAATITFKKIAAAGQITISRAGTDTIEFATTAVLNNAGESITIRSDGVSNWDII